MSTVILKELEQKPRIRFPLDRIVKPIFTGPPHRRNLTYALEEGRLETVRENLVKFKKWVSKSEVERWLFAEVFSEDGRHRLISGRRARYKSTSVKSVSDVNGDFWDNYSRLFVLTGNPDDSRKAYFSKSIRITARDNPYLLPTEINLITSQEEIEGFRERFGNHPDKHLLGLSTLDRESRRNLQAYLSRYSPHDQEEVGGLFGDDRVFVSPVMLVIGFGVLTSHEETRKSAIITIHPSHKNLYLKTLPFQQLTEHYTDHFGREAVTLGLDYDHLVKVKPELDDFLQENLSIPGIANASRSMNFQYQ